MSKHEEKKTSYKWKKVVKYIFIAILIMIICIVTYFYYSFRKNTYIKDSRKDLNNPTTESKYKEVEGINNILLVGSDARDLNEKSRSDAIMILTIDNIHKKIKITSIMRDSYVDIPNHGEQKINHSFALGGINLLEDTIEKNFNIKLDKYAIINFKGFQQLIDSIGGIEVDIKSNEMKEMNKFIPEVNPKDPHFINKTGIQKLDGQQVLSYVRIRHINNGDYDRAKRQREAMSLIIDKIKDTNVLKYPLMASKLLPYVKTNMDVTEILDYAYTVYKINNFNLEQLQIPVNQISKPAVIKNKGWIILMDKDQNSKVLHDFIFEDRKYKVSELDINSFKNIMKNYEKQIYKGKDVDVYKELDIIQYDNIIENKKTKKNQNKNIKSKDIKNTDNMKNTNNKEDAITNNNTDVIDNKNVIQDEDNIKNKDSTEIKKTDNSYDKNNKENEVKKDTQQKNLEEKHLNDSKSNKSNNSKD